MSKSKPVASLSNLIDSDMEEVGNEIHTLPDSNQENNQPAKNGKKERRAPTRSKVATTRSARLHASQTKTATVVAKKKPPPRKKAATKRTALEDHYDSNREEGGNVFDQAEQNSEIEQNAASMDELVPKEQPKKRGRPAKKANQEPREESAQPAKPTEIDGEFEYTPVVVRIPPSKNSVTAKQAVSGKLNFPAVQRSPKIIPETQLPSFDHVPRYPEQDEDLEDELPQSVLPKRRIPARPQHFPSRKRAGSVSETDNPAGRRRIGEVTKKLDVLDIKYKNLREVGIKEAEANFERLKAQSETQSNAADDLIQSMKKELATQTTIAQESRSLQRQLAARDASLSKAEETITELTTSLSDSQNEIKSLQAKLANSRSASVAVESMNARTPGSAINNKAQPRTIMMGSAEAAQAAQVALLKEDLYSDLTGLILRGVERGEDSDIYDCIQTGRNGTLHFKLAVANDSDAKVNYEDTTFLYTPRLDSNRDRDLLELLPDYLSEEIAFSRVNAAKFYGRVMETLTKRRGEDS